MNEFWGVQMKRLRNKMMEIHPEIRIQKHFRGWSVRNKFKQREQKLERER